MSVQTHRLFTEIFPVRTEDLPPIHAYRVEVDGNEAWTVGGKLAYRLKRAFKGHWAWSASRILTDAPQPQKEIDKIVEICWAEQPEIYRALKQVIPDTNWRPNNRAQAGFVARGLLSDAYKDIHNVLQHKRQDLGNAYVERVYDVRDWIVEAHPAVSVSISSRLVHKQDLKRYASTVSPDALVGLEVADKTSTLKGFIVGIVGKLAEERDRLLLLTQREEMQQRISEAPDDELVVQVSTGRTHPYNYIVSALRIVLRTEYFRRFGVDGQRALRAMTLEPELRAGILQDVANVVTRNYLDRGFNSPKYPERFLTSRFSTKIQMGSNKTLPFENQISLADLKQQGVYKKAAQFENDEPIRIAVVDALQGANFSDFLRLIEHDLRALRFGVQKVGQVKVEEGSRSELELAINRLEEEKPDVILAFFPNDFEADDDEETAYYHFKSLTVGKGIPSQVVEQSTLKNKWAVGNIVMGIVGKTGNIPYVLAEPLDFADVVVGIDIARERKQSLPGSINATAIARIYLTNGEFLRYVIHDAPLPGETIPDSVLQSLFPIAEFSGKRVIIHRDGIFRGNEKQALKTWAKKMGAQFYLVEVIKTGAPRIYGITSPPNSDIVQPRKGNAFLVSDVEALLVSSLPPTAKSTPNPLRIRTEAPFTIEQAISSVLMMTTLHYGSLRSPRLPVSVHYSDKISYMALRGIKPRNLEGSIPYWL